MTAAAPIENPVHEVLQAAKLAEKTGRHLRQEGRDEEALAAFERAKELYDDSGLAYGRDDKLRDEVQKALNRCSTIMENIRRPRTSRPPATTPRPNCLDCGKPLRRYKYDGTFKDGTPREWGDYGDQRFCGLRCGWSWACKHTTRKKP